MTVQKRGTTSCDIVVMIREPAKTSSTKAVIFPKLTRMPTGANQRSPAHRAGIPARRNHEPCMGDLNGHSLDHPKSAQTKNYHEPSRPKSLSID